MNVSISAKAVEEQIIGDILACKTLIKLLDDEHEALKAQNPDALAAIIEQKVPPLMRLEESAKQRAAWASITEEQKASLQWKAFLDEFNNPKIVSDWDLLKSLTRECQYKNEVNGKALVRHQQIYGRLIDLLRGQTKAPGLYNAYGSTTSSNNSLRLDQA